MSIGERIREERERLGFTQPAFAALADTTKKSQIDYEKDLTQPKAGYLFAISRVGADVQYIVTAERSSNGLSSEEQVLLDGYRSLDVMTKRRALAFMLTESGPLAVGRKIKEKTAETGNKTITVTASGHGTQAAGRKIVNHGKDRK